MNLIDQKVEFDIQNQIIGSLVLDDIKHAVFGIENVLGMMYDLIPDNKRISYGRVHTVKLLSKYLFDKAVDPEKIKLVFDGTNNWYAKSTALGVISYYALDDYKSYLIYFEKAAADDNWDVREMAQMFFRKLIKKYPEQIQLYLIELTKSKNENIRRFVGETIRPVCENGWFQEKPEYSLNILKHLFKEKSAYPRTSVGNNLSDLARQNPELVCKIVKDLVDSADKNSNWIAYRACRNLVKKEPERIMDLLKVDEYKYKKAKYLRNNN